MKCAGDKEKLNLAAIKIYDRAKAQIEVYRDRNVDVYKALFVIPVGSDWRMDDVLILKMKIKDKGIKED